ncbi:ABC transporter ATP-binding protein [Dehalococcoidia bacterium]|nr:ABC transporter ATP-binding protein [Dehalococcoidia bacterium]MCL0065762.1 ABC transporter ATP-binding protein [Dehalococcoidia bacterium]MCL0073683.1 ABC transporter ATP-binding protein [Dehalococcoidia bacterium]MCL0075765.1 ABC transporter ATP-binding protein [Dehalococcoidia bacterium]MCL0076973.1 ABC transporter ATP-binding protein [Dehalococcoidia bacterium]
MLEIKELEVSSADRKILKDINLAIPAGEVHALLGHNGCGKTTLMMAIMGYPAYDINRGEIAFSGKSINELGVTERANLGIGILHQHPPKIKGVKLRQIIDFAIGKKIQPAEVIAELIEKFQMEPFIDREINLAFSGGELKRSELFQLLITQPKFAMIDEPDSGVDLENIKVIGTMVNELFAYKCSERIANKRSGLIITHTGDILDYVPIDRAHVMLDGRIICSGNPRAILNQIRLHGYESCADCFETC